MPEVILDILLDTVFDSLKMLPFLFAAYLIIEYIEQRHSAAMERLLAESGKFGFLTAGLLGLIPQCGFSAMAAELYAGNVITAGTLIAVFLATSDEAVPILIASPELWGVLTKLLALKFVTAVLGGILTDYFLKKIAPSGFFGGYRGRMDEVNCSEHREEESIVRAAVRHTLNIFFWIAGCILALNCIMEFFGGTVLTAFLRIPGVLQIAAAGLVGLIPNCAASVLLTQLYSSGSISFAALFSGLSVGSGVGTLVLLRSLKNKKKAAAILFLTYCIGTGAALLLAPFL